MGPLQQGFLSFPLDRPPRCFCTGSSPRSDAGLFVSTDEQSPKRSLQRAVSLVEVHGAGVTSGAHPECPPRYPHS